MRAARFTGPGLPISVEEVPDPEPGPSDVVVRVEACGICASDLHFLHGEIPLPVVPPLTLGHEPSGVVEAVGPEVPVWQPGDRVSVAAGKACLRCRNCAAGLLEDCRAPQVMGAHYDGAFAELVVAPWYALAKLPEEVPFEHGAIACDAVSTPYAALLDRGALRPGERVGLWGIGGLGTHAVQIARLAGASFVAAIDPIPEARERALRLGADAAYDPSEDVPNAIRDATRGRGLDLALDLIGKQAVIRQAMASCTRGARVVVVGQSFEPLDLGPLAFVSFLGLSILGHLGYSKRHLEQVLTLMATGRLDVSGSISDRLPLDRVQEGVDRLSSKEGAPVRLLVTPNAG
ncbi:MAG TPA: zinc-binding dehydrogenase [Actinomycetota bacterium]|nr:zinc-binding dehydrogenase [Actinomycetota bacterium]